jgi:hypothetical protein
MAKIRFTDIDSCEIETIDLGFTRINEIVDIFKVVNGFRLKDERYFDKTGFININFSENMAEIQLNYEK